MCGIVGYTGKNQAVNFLVEGLKTLEYRGYDSAGVEVLSTDGELHGVKCAGRVAVLDERCKTANLVGTTGIEEKLDIFFAAGKLTEAEYSELIGMLHPEKAAGEKA